MHTPTHLLITPAKVMYLVVDPEPVHNPNAGSAALTTTNYAYLGVVGGEMALDGIYWMGSGDFTAESTLVPFTTDPPDWFGGLLK